MAIRVVETKSKFLGRRPGPLGIVYGALSASWTCTVFRPRDPGRVLHASLREDHLCGWSMRDLGREYGTDHNPLFDLMIADRLVAQILEREVAADAVVVGSRPNGLAANVAMASADLDKHLGWRSGSEAAP